MVGSSQKMKYVGSCEYVAGSEGTAVKERQLAVVEQLLRTALREVQPDRRKEQELAAVNCRAIQYLLLQIIGAYNPETTTEQLVAFKELLDAVKELAAVNRQELAAVKKHSAASWLTRRPMQYKWQQ